VSPTNKHGEGSPMSSEMQSDVHQAVCQADGYMIWAMTMGYVYLKFVMICLLFTFVEATSCNFL